MNQPRLLIEEWLPAAALGVECARERSTGQQPPDKRFHVWWARRPLVVSRAAVLGSLLPADFPRDTFERLLGFGRPGTELVTVRQMMDTGVRVPGGFMADRAFKGVLREDDLARAHQSTKTLWGDDIVLIDPMAGGGSIPLESARLGFRTLANDYNPVACSVLEASTDYPFRFGRKIADEARTWSTVLLKRVEERLACYYPAYHMAKVHAYIFARTVPCPDTQFPTPLVPDWYLGKGTPPICAVPIVDTAAGTWHTTIREIGTTAGRLRQAPPPTYNDGKGVSLFTGAAIPSEYIKAQAQAGKLGSALYAVAVKTGTVLEFRPPEPADHAALAAAAQELNRLRPAWEASNIIPTEKVPTGDKTDEALVRGFDTWAEMFSPRQLLAFGTLVDELRALRPEIVKALIAKQDEKLGNEQRVERGTALADAVVHLLAFGLDKFANWNAQLSSWNVKAATARSVFDRHDFAFKATYCEMAPCNAGTGLAWAIKNSFDAYDELARLPHHPDAQPVHLSQGSATNLPQIADGSVTAVVVDPPYADNVQYSELADFFYVWLKRTQGYRRPEWFSTYLCDHTEEAVVNLSRFRVGKQNTAAAARAAANVFYQDLMTQVFTEARRILRDDGALTVMFTHKKQEAWEALFASLIGAGFTITATWPVKTENQHSLHQARKNAAQSTVLLVARKRLPQPGMAKAIGYFDQTMQRDIRDKAIATADRLQREGLNAVDQLVGSFGPAMEVYSRYDEVRTDTGEPVGVGFAIDVAADAVSRWRIQQLAPNGLEDVEPEGRFTLLCWDVLQAAEFRFNEAKLLGMAVGMDVEQLIAAGLVSKSSDNIKMLSAADRRRDKPLTPDEVQETLFGPVTIGRRRRKSDVLQIHPNDPSFRTALDGCHALALRHSDAGGGNAGIGSARALMQQQGWTGTSPVAQLMDALVRAAPEALRYETTKTSVAARFPEFRAWHALLTPLFGITPPDWTVAPALQPALFAEQVGMDDEADDGEDNEGDDA